MAECQVFRNDDGVIERVEAPNGQPSTLYKTLQDLVKDKEQALRLWAQVYTDSFKNWFGDWEKGQGSKTVDANGEPLIVYHGGGDLTGKTINVPFHVAPSMEEAAIWASRPGKTYGGGLFSRKDLLELNYNGVKDSSGKQIKTTFVRDPKTKEYTPSVERAIEILDEYEKFTLTPLFISTQNNWEETELNGKELKELRIFNPNQVKSVLNEGSFAIDKGGYDNTQVRTEAIPSGGNVVERKMARKSELEGRGAFNVQFIEGGIKYSFDPTNIYFQDKEMESSTASAQTIAKIKEVLNKMGVSIEELYSYAKKNNIDVKGKSGLADLTRGVIAIADQQEGQALTEEMVHIATAMIEQTNPALITQMISKIDRFKIYKETFEAYKDTYTLPNGKPDIRRIKKEAVDKLIAELIVNQMENTDQFPELREEVNQSFVRNLWNTILDFIKGMYTKANIDIFTEVASQIGSGDISGDIADMKQGGIFFQLSDAQKKIVDSLDQTKNTITKVYEDQEKVDPILLDSEEASNYYQAQKPDGTTERVLKRVTDRVKAWYKKKFPGKIFTKQEKEFNELKRKFGVKGHQDLEDIHHRYYNEDGTRRVKPIDAPSTFNLDTKQMYQLLENYYVKLIDSFDKDTIIRAEVIIYNSKDKEAGTIDFLAIEPDGKTHILDWKFLQFAEGSEDVAFFKQGAYDIQLGTYKDILRNYYGVKSFGMTRAIPIMMKMEMENKPDGTSENVIKGIAIGSVDPKQITDLRLLPVSEKTESTGYQKLDKYLAKLNSLYERISSQPAEEEERQFKYARMRELKRAIRLAQGTGNIAELINVILTTRAKGEQLINTYDVSFKNRDANSEDSTNEELSEFAGELRNYIETAEIFDRVDAEIGDLIYSPEMEIDAKTDEDKKLLNELKTLRDNLKREGENIYTSKQELIDIAFKFADKHIGQRNLITGLTKPEAVTKGLASNFRGLEDLGQRSLNILAKLNRQARTNANADSLEEIKELMDIRERFVKRGGDIRQTIKKIYQKDDKGQWINRLVYKFDKKFFEEVDARAAAGGDMTWLRNNIDVDAYKKEADAVLEKNLKRINEQFPGDSPEIVEKREKAITQESRKYDITRKDFNGWNNYIIKRHPISKWESADYKDIKNDPDLLALYNYVSKINKKANQEGFIQNSVSSFFLPFVRKTMAESLVWDGKLSVMDNFYQSLKINPDDVGYGKFDEITGKMENSIPKYYTYDFTNKDGVNDYSEVSEDLFKNMILYIQQVNKYKYLTEVEEQVKFLRTIEEFKNAHLAVDRVSNIVMDDDGEPKVMTGNDENIKMLDDFTRAVFYEQKYVLSDTDTPLYFGKVVNGMKGVFNSVVGREVFKPNEQVTATSMIKTMDAMNRGFQIKTLGLEFLSGAVNAFGTNIQMAAQAGEYFKAREFAKNEAKLLLQNIEDKQKFVELINTFLPLSEDPSYEMFKKAGLTTLTQNNLGDMLMIFMKYPEQHAEKTTFLTLLENTMVVDGKIVSIPKYVKNKYKDRNSSQARYRETKPLIEKEIEELKKDKSIAATSKMEDGKLVIPGLDLSNKKELQRLGLLSKRLSEAATGNVSKENMNRMGMSIWTASMMVFKRWIPKLADTRFSEFRKVANDFSVEFGEEGIHGESYDIGRIRLLGSVLGRSIMERSNYIKDILVMNDAGIAELDRMYYEYAQEYKKRTGEEMTMTKDDFIDMVRNNLRNQLKELAILLSLLGAMLALGIMAPDDDEGDRASRNFHRYAQKTVDKFVGELSFFYNPAEVQRLASGSIFPAIGVLDDVSKFTKHFFIETTGMDFDPSTTEEEARKKARPIKYLMKAAPVTKSILTYGAIFSPEFAKEFDITIQKQNR